MAQKMLQFVRTEKRMPDKRDASARRHDFEEIYGEFDQSGAEEQSSRCSQCGVPFCQVHCPLHNNIPDWLKLTAEGRLEEAYEMSSATSNLPEICGRICPQDRLCEGNCTIEQSTHGTVTIGSIEKYINDTAWERGWVKPRLPDARAAAVGRHHRRRPRRHGGGGTAPRQGLRGPRLRPLRPDRRPDDVRHSRLQAGEVRRRSPGQAAGRPGRDLPYQFRSRPRRHAGGSARETRRRPDRDRRL